MTEFTGLRAHPTQKLSKMTHFTAPASPELRLSVALPAMPTALSWYAVNGLQAGVN